jgi:hypothetical protein
MIFNAVFQRLQGEGKYPQKPFDWKEDKNGQRYSAEQLYDEYFRQLEYARKRFMESPTG